MVFLSMPASVLHAWGMINAVSADGPVQGCTEPYIHLVYVLCFQLCCIQIITTFNVHRVIIIFKTHLMRNLGTIVI